MVKGFFTGAVVILFVVVPGKADSLSVDSRYFGISGGLGVSLVHAADIVEYVTYRSGLPSKQDDFTTAGEFFGAAELQIADDWGLKVEYAYLTKSYNIPQAITPEFVFSYNVHMPTAVLHYIVAGKGYFLKFGGGAGYHVSHFTEDYFISTVASTAKGIGLKLEAEGNTMFDDHLYAYISGDIRNEILGEYKDSATHPRVIPSSGKNVKMNFYSFGIKFGFSYFF